MKIVKYKVIDSTNKYLMASYQEHPHFTVVTSDHQTHGKGRFSRQWIDNKGSALFSVLLKEDLALETLSQIPMIAAVSIHKAIAQNSVDLKIKWPNDLLVATKKIAGILTQSVIDNTNLRAVVVGFGINVNNKEFPDELTSIATSLFLETAKVIEIDSLIKKIMLIFQRELFLIKDKSHTFLDYYNSHSALFGKEILYLEDNITKKAVAQNTLLNGNLMISTSQGDKLLSSGEVHILKH